MVEAPQRLRPRRPKRSTPQDAPRRVRRSSPALSPDGSAVADAWALFLATHTDLAEKTRREYAGDLRQFVAWWEIGADRSFRPRAFRTDLVTTASLAAYREYLQDELEMSWRSVNRALTSLKQFYARWAVPVWGPGAGLTLADPAGEVRLVKKGAQKPPRQLTPDEVELLVRAAAQTGDTQSVAMVRVMSTSGLRAEEMCGLGRSSFHAGTTWDAPTLTVTGKGNKVRAVPIPRDTERLLQGHMEALPEKQRHLWTNQAGHPFTYSNLYDLLEKYSELAGVFPTVRPHDLRHFYGYEQAARGTPLHRIKEYMGHESIDTTEIYTKGRAADRKADAERMGWR